MKFEGKLRALQTLCDHVHNYCYTGAEQARYSENVAAMMNRTFYYMQEKPELSLPQLAIDPDQEHAGHSVVPFERATKQAEALGERLLDEDVLHEHVGVHEDLTEWRDSVRASCDAMLARVDEDAFEALMERIGRQDPTVQHTISEVIGHRELHEDLVTGHTSVEAALRLQIPENPEELWDPQHRSTLPFMMHGRHAFRADEITYATSPDMQQQIFPIAMQYTGPFEIISFQRKRVDQVEWWKE